MVERFSKQSSYFILDDPTSSNVDCICTSIYLKFIIWFYRLLFQLYFIILFGAEKSLGRYFRLHQCLLQGDSQAAEKIKSAFGVIISNTSSLHGQLLNQILLLIVNFAIVFGF